MFFFEGGISNQPFWVYRQDYHQSKLTVVVNIYSYSINFLKLIVFIEKSQVKKIDTCNFQ